ncbi:M-phase phosphoprotein 9 isoform X2 [Periophthalmus magnuspinnatus]|uniref:M-phase phosphoprotein 9 isoform X2 n=1 Tax=Periophthalmus magnuspinnatus TaxID=409849 RepID=UPI0024372BF2|nr:M-phase phosphoprotein 9 isoform X2 [Periophthalmus magnuspinnatus]
MSTDDSISEDVSSSGALSHCPVSADGDGGKESETSLVSSEGTSAPGLSVSEDRLTASHTTGGTVQCQPMDTPALQNIRDICLSPEVFGHGKNLPFINPSSIETLRALVQEIRSSGETNPEIWKDCEGRWLHLFQLVEKQYQEQILAQQEQYQCQIQLIQDEIKALVQIQNRQGSFQPHKEFSTVPKANAGDHALPPVSTHCSTGSLEVGEVTTNEPANTVLSSGYGTMFPWEAGIETSDANVSQKKHPMSLNTEDKTSYVNECQRKYSSTKKPGLERVSQQINQQLTSSSNQQLTSWVQMNKLRPKRNKAGPLSMVAAESEELHNKHVESHQLIQFKSTESLDQNQPGGLSYGLRRSDSLISEASGLTYWRLHENDLYHPLPDSFDSGVHLSKDQSMGSIPCQPSQLSLKEIYCNKQETDFKRADRDGSCKSTALSPQPQALALDHTVTTRHSDRTSGFTSPSHFSSPSFSTPSHPGLRAETPLTPDSHNPGEVDYTSDASSICAARRSTLKMQDQWGLFPLPAPHNSFQHQAPVQSEPTHQTEGSCSVEDPVFLSLLRQNLREKHSRHVADLKAYYESEIQNLLDKLRLKDLPKDIEKSNQALSERCQHLEKALAEATSRIQELETNNSSLEKKITEWSERYAVAAATMKSLQKRLEENKRSAKERDTIAAKLKSRIRQLEEAAQKAEREANENRTKRETEYKMLQDLLVEYDSLVKNHDGLKSNLASTENKLVDAHGQISELKRIISKLESQVKQLDHENQARVRYSLHNNTLPSGAGLFHHPDLLLSPTKRNAQPDVIHTFSHSPIEQMNDGAKSLATIQSTKSAYKKCDHLSSGNENPVDITTGGSWNPDCVPPQPQLRLQDVSRKSGSSFITPMMRALIELEETQATQSRAPWVDNSKSTVGFVERRLKVPIQEQDILQDLAKPHKRVEKDRVRALQRSLSPESHRSSSLPPPAQRNMPLPNTPSKRETLLMPLSAKSSPKRCPTENFSTAFGHLMPREEHLQHSPRKKLLFSSADTDHGQHPSDSPGNVQPSEVNRQQDWDERRNSTWEEDTRSPRLDRQLSLSEAERLFDELTQEKLQIEAALSRMPGTGRQSLQTRIDEVALENRLERLNRELGSLRMTLKRFHVLRSSANL